MRDLIPVNTQYYSFRTGETLYGDGINRFPDIAQDDKFITSDYIYTFEENGWRVKVLDQDRTAYSVILNSVNGMKTISMERAFLNCSKLKVAPAIPKSVTNLDTAFRGCKKLVEAPKIPDGVMDLLFTFSGCESMTTAPEIPKSVNHLQETFAGCTAMEGTLVCHANPTTYKEAFL